MPAIFFTLPADSSSKDIEKHNGMPAIFFYDHFVHVLGAMEKFSFFSDFDSISLRGGTLEPPGRPWTTKWVRRLIF
jgi:hypothetical protein